MPKTAISITASDVRCILKETRLGKSARLDSLAAAHFVYSYNSVTVHLSLLFNCMLNHGYIQSDFMNTSIIPILKNRNGDTSDKNNYRHIAIVTAMSKHSELCLSRILDEYFCSGEDQFGFKRKLATDLCIYTVKSVIKYYNYFSSPLFTCFLDASKAFEKVNHWTLLKKLLLKAVPTVLVRILCFGIVHNNCVYNGVKLNLYSSQMQMVSDREEICRLNYFLSTWMIFQRC